MLSENPFIREDLEKILSSDVPWEKLRGKTILISGAAGFLPAYMLMTLALLNEKINAGIEIIGLVRNKEKAEKKFGSLTGKKIRLIVQDVSSEISINAPLHYIVHAASQASPKYYGIDPVGTLNANTLGTSNLLQVALAQKNPESFLYFSSSEVYGIVDESKIPTKESDYGYIDLSNVRSCYAESKRMGEVMCISYLHQHKIPVKIVRPFHTYGPGMDLNDGRVYADFISDIHHNRDIVMKSDGSARRAFCYLTDATIGFFKVLLTGKNGEAYNIGNDNAEISILELAEQLVTLFPEKNLKVVRKPVDNNYLASTVSRNCPDSSKMKELGWAASTGIKEGFYRTIKSYA